MVFFKIKVDACISIHHVSTYNFLGKSFCFKVFFLGAQLLFNFFLALPSAQRSQGNLKDITSFFFSFLLERRLQFKLSTKSFPLGTWVEISNSTLDTLVE